MRYIKLKIAVILQKLLSDGTLIRIDSDNKRYFYLNTQMMCEEELFPTTLYFSYDEKFYEEVSEETYVTVLNKFLECRQNVKVARVSVNAIPNYTKLEDLEYGITSVKIKDNEVVGHIDKSKLDLDNYVDSGATLRGKSYTLEGGLLNIDNNKPVNFTSDIAENRVLKVEPSHKFQTPVERDNSYFIEKAKSFDNPEDLLVFIENLQFKDKSKLLLDNLDGILAKYKLGKNQKNVFKKALKENLSVISKVIR